MLLSCGVPSGVIEINPRKFGNYCFSLFCVFHLFLIIPAQADAERSCSYYERQWLVLAPNANRLQVLKPLLNKMECHY